MAILSINLGVINLFPIPILDGGHFLFLGLEAILRRPISIKKMEIAQQIGLIFIILLMLFAFYNDLIRIFFPGGFRFLRMKVLGIDTSTSCGSVGLIDDEGVISEYLLNLPVTHSERLLGAIELVLKEARCMLLEIWMDGRSPSARVPLQD